MIFFHYTPLFINIPLANNMDEFLFKIRRDREIKPLINKWLQLNSNKNLHHIMKEIIELCIWMERHRMKMNVYYNGRIIGWLDISYDGSMICKIQPGFTVLSLMGTKKFKWLPDVIGWADCDKILTPIEGARYINYHYNSMIGANIFEYYQGKWVETIPKKGSLIYLTAVGECLYYNGAWSECIFDVSKDNSDI
jgi:hypothetical protein